MQVIQTGLKAFRIQNPKHQSIVDMLSFIVFACLLVLIIVAWVSFWENPARIPIALIAMPVLVTIYILLRIGYIASAKFLAVYGITILIIGLSTSSYGVYAPIYLASVLPIVLATLLYSASMSVVICFITILSGFGMIVLARQGVIAVPDSGILPLPIMWGTQSSIFLMIAIMSFFARHNMNDAVAQAEKYARELKERNHDLDMEIAERIAANEALKISEERYRTIVEDQPNFIVRWKPDGTLTFANQNYCADIRMPLDKVIGANFLDWSTEDNVNAILKKIGSLTPQHPMQISTYKSSNHEGQPIWHQWSDRGIFDAAGNLTAVESIGTDITSQKLLEEKMIQLQLLEEREAFLQEFLGTMTHDLKTPLSVMNTSLYLAQKSPDNEAQSRHFGRLQRQINLQEKMINDILEVVRLNHLPAQKSELVSINAIIILLKERLQSKVEAKNIQFQLALAPNLVEIMGDAEQVERMLVNLIENAINYTPENGTVSIATHLRKNHILISITDTGIGIPEDDLESIFTQFYRAKNALKIEGGTGLGLAIVKRIIELHDGQISVESEIEKGTNFSITLPLAPSEN